MAVIRNILVRVGANIAPLQQNMTQAQHTMSTFQSNMASVNSSTKFNMGSTRLAVLLSSNLTQFQNK